MSDIIRNVTIALRLRPDAPPDLAQYTQGVKAYYGEILTNAANATTANNLLGESYKRITADLAAATQGALNFNQATGGIAQYYATVISQSDEAAKAIRTLSQEYNALQGIGAKLQPPSIMAPNGFPTGGGLDPGFIDGSGRGNIGFTPSTEGVQSLDQAAEATAKFADEIDRLITSGMKFETIQDAVQKFAEATMDALGVVDPTQRMIGIQTIMEDAKKHVERYQEVDNATTQKMMRNWQGAQQSMMTAVSAASRLVSAVGFLTGSSDDVEELAKRFANVQVSIQAMTASSAMFNNTSEGLQKINQASIAAQTQLAMLGGTAGFTTRILAGVGPAATAMQAALGPISLVITGIGLAFTVAQTAAAIWGDTNEDSAQRSEEALRKYEEQLRAVSRELDVQTQLIDNQTRSTMLLYETNKLAKGGSFTLEQAQSTGQDMAVMNQQAEKAALQAALAKAKEALPESIKAERGVLQSELEQRQKSVAEKENELRYSSKLLGKSVDELKAEDIAKSKRDGVSSAEADRLDPWGALQLQKDKIAQFDRMRGVTGLEQTISSGDPAQIAKALKDLQEVLPQSVEIIGRANLDALGKRAEAPKFVIGEVNELIRAEIAKAKGEGVDIGKGADGKYMVDADREMEKARRQFEAERQVAQSLIADPMKMTELQFGIQSAQNPLQALQGISQYIPDDQEQSLRGNANLSIRDVEAALSDAAEFESEKTSLEQFIAEKQQQTDFYKESIKKLVNVISEQESALMKVSKDLEDQRRASR